MPPLGERGLIMIFIQDNYLPTELFKQLQEHCLNTEFEIIKVGEKEFSTIPTPKEILPFLQAEGYKMTLTFIRSAYKDFDTDYRIHADNIINGEKTAMASVLYINNNDITSNGTAFFNHNKYGHKLPENCTNEEFDRLLKEDANDISKWKQTDTVYSKPNRLLMYDANYFHAKFPQVIEQGTRIVLVTFYSKL